MLADSYCQHCHFQGLRPILPLLKRSHTIIFILIQLLLSDHRLRGLPQGQPCHLGRHKLVSQLNSRHGNYQSHSISLNSELTKISKHDVFHFFNRLGRRPWTSKEMFVKVGTWAYTWSLTSSKWVKKTLISKFSTFRYFNTAEVYCNTISNKLLFLRMSQKSNQLFTIFVCSLTQKVCTCAPNCLERPFSSAGEKSSTQSSDIWPLGELNIGFSIVQILPSRHILLLSNSLSVPLHKLSSKQT